MPRGRPPGSKNKKTLEKEPLFNNPVVEENIESTTVEIQEKPEAEKIFPQLKTWRRSCNKIGRRVKDTV